MMKLDAKGVTLIELIIVVSIIAILIVALGFSFQGWMAGYRIESQVKEMHVDLMNARTNALQRNRAHFVIVATNNYQIFEDTNENGAYNAGVDAGMVRFTNPKTLGTASLWAGTVTMNTRGLVDPNNTIRFNIGTNTPDYDCIVLFDTRINIGLWGDCDNNGGTPDECCAQ